MGKGHNKLQLSTNPETEKINVKESYNPNDPNKNDNFEDDLNKSGSDMEVNASTYQIKIIMLGNSSVGKSSILKRYFHNKFEDNSTAATVSAIFQSKKIKVDPFTIADLQIWDTAGQEQFRSMTKTYIYGSNGIVLVFDLTDEKSFNDLDYWLEEINDAVDKDKVIKILIGNKCDLHDKKISYDRANKYAEKNNMKFYTVSAKDGINIDMVYEILGNECYKKMQEEQKRQQEEDIKEKEDRISSLSGQFENNVNEQNEIKTKKCC